MPTRRSAVLLLAALLLLGGASPAAGQTEVDVVSVGLRPAVGAEAGPNDGTWFVAEATPGAVVEMRVRITNPATVPQQVSLYVADLQIAGDGTPAIGARTAGVGDWGGFERPSVVVPARSELVERLALAVPSDVDPGDHLGAVVAESAPEGRGAVRVVKRVANRLYVTVPGDTRPGMDLLSVDVAPDRVLAPRWATVTVTLRNTGDVRLRPRVRVGGPEATGSSLLMSRSVERYTVRKRLAPWGGPVQFPVEVRSTTGSDEGPAIDDDGQAFVLPVVPVLVLALLAMGLLAWRRLPHRRRRQELEADLRQLREELRARDQGGGSPAS